MRCPSAKESLAALMLPAMCLIAGCSAEMRSALAQMRELQTKVIEKYQAENATVMLRNGSTLIVSLINSPLSDLPETEQEMRAKEIAVYVKSNYASIDKVQRIGVSIVRRRTSLLFFHSSTMRSYSYDVGEIGQTGDAR